MVQGKFTYIVAGVTALWAVVGYFLGNLDAVTAGQMVLAALGVFGVRRAIDNK